MWKTKWGMSFNPSKCEAVTFSRKKIPIRTPYILKNEELRSSSTASYLGIAISENLSWNEQITKATAKGNRALGFIKRNIKTSSKDTKSIAYKSLVRPTLEYASTVWSPGQKTLEDTIEMVQ